MIPWAEELSGRCRDCGRGKLEGLRRSTGPSEDMATRTERQRHHSKPRYLKCVLRLTRRLIDNDSTPLLRAYIQCGERSLTQFQSQNKGNPSNPSKL